jgi:hypothetical protein
VSPAELITSRLEGRKLKRTGRGSWVACCPHHEDRTPSLSITEADDGRVLIHCHAGCHVEQVVGALGLALTDLFPDDGAGRAPMQRRISYRQGLELIKQESTLVWVAASNMAKGHQLSEEDRLRLQRACIRMQAVFQELGL